MLHSEMAAVAAVAVRQLVNWPTCEWIQGRPRADQNTSWSVGVVLGNTAETGLK